MTQVIKYNDKEYKLPFAVGLSDEPTAIETVANRFSGEEVQLPQLQQRYMIPLQVLSI
jgi:hypothetical protein